MNRVNSDLFGRISVPKKPMLHSSAVPTLLCAGILSMTSSVSLADESGTSFWLPGTYESLAAVPARRDGRLLQFTIIRPSVPAPMSRQRAKSRLGDLIPP
jgi:hypothetical protein